MFGKKDKEKAKKLQETAKQAIDETKNAMEELGDEALGAVSGAGEGNPFASHSRVSTKQINDSVRNKG